MKKSLLQHQYSRLQEQYLKLSSRLNKQLASGSFSSFSKAQQVKLVQRIECIQAQLRRLGSALALGAALYSTPAVAQFASAGSEFKVNTYTTGNQRNPSVAADSDGDFVVVWQDYDQSGAYSDIYAQRYNASGAAQGAEFKVNTTTVGSQSGPRVAIDSDGDFVVVWISNDGDGFGVYGQRFNASGAAQGVEFLVNTYTTGAQQSPSVAIDSDGDFVVVWSSDLQDGSNSGIYGQRYNASGAAQGTEFLVNATTTGSQLNPTIALDSDGDFVVAWESFLTLYNDIYAQRYNASGATQGPEFQVNTGNTSNKYVPSVAIDSDGDFVVVWQSADQDGNGFGIYGQRYNATGASQGAEFLVNTYTTEGQRKPSVAIDSDGDFVVVWYSYDQEGTGGKNGIYAKRYNASGTVQGSEFKVNTYTTSYQQTASVATDSNGDLVIAWESYSQEGSGPNYGIYAQRYTNTTTGIADGLLTPTTVLHPNPARDRVQLGLDGSASVKIMDLSGLVVLETVLKDQGFSVDGLKTGVYLVEIAQEGKTAVRKLMVE